jgi:dienelactone hydrolase
VSLLLTAVAFPLSAQTYDLSAPAGENFSTAAFRLWHPDEIETVRGVVVLVPGSNGDGRSQVEDPIWRDFAARHGLALLGVHLTDAPHAQMFIERYVDVGKGSGQALLESLERFAERSAHPELASAPLFLWGMSAGGQFNYEFAMWKPERVAAFVVNKGGIYYTAQAPEASQKVPGFFFIGGTDLEYRNDIIAGIFAINRRAGALWALAVEPGVSHEVAGSKEVALQFFEELIPLRILDSPGRSAPTGLIPLDPDQGFIADPKTREVVPSVGAPRTTYPTSWLPTEGLSRAWLEMTGG